MKSFPIDMASLVTPDDWQGLAVSVADETLGTPKAPLADLVRETSGIYTRGRNALEQARGDAAHQARLRFFLARDVFKLDVPLSELAFAGALPEEKTWQLLDLGAGLGTTTLSVARHAARHGRKLRVDAVDADPVALKVLRAFASWGDFSVQTHVGDATRFAPPGTYDLITLGLFLNELPYAKRLALLGRLVPVLRPGGSILIVEPALKEVTRDLHRLRGDLLEEGWTVFAPCLHEAPCPMLEGERDWCHEDRAFRLPEASVPVAKAAGLRFERITYAYLTLRRDGRRLRSAVHPADRRVVSGRLRSKGKQELFVCGPAASDDMALRQKWVRLDRRRSTENEAFDRVVRGDLLRAAPLTVKGDGLRLEAETEVVRTSLMEEIAGSD